MKTTSDNIVPALLETAPSRTAMMTAAGRAVHLFRTGPHALLADWFAWPLVGPVADEVVAGVRPLVDDKEAEFATWFAARARLTEDWLAASGAEQYVVLGAGLDSFAWRQPGDIAVFEVDHPSTQGWKRARLATLGVEPPATLTWVPVDFERDELSSALSRAGLDPGRSTFVSWVGVIPYLTRDAIIGTLRQLPPCSLALGYLPPDAERDEDSRSIGRVVDGMVRALGEPWLTMTNPAELAALLAEAGFTVTDDVGAHDIEGRYGHRAINYERMALARAVTGASRPE